METRIGGDCDIRAGYLFSLAYGEVLSSLTVGLTNTFRWGYISKTQWLLINVRHTVPASASSCDLKSSSMIVDKIRYFENFYSAIMYDMFIVFYSSQQRKYKTRIIIYYVIGSARH